MASAVDDIHDAVDLGFFRAVSIDRRLVVDVRRAFDLWLEVQDCSVRRKLGNKTDQQARLLV